MNCGLTYGKEYDCLIDGLGSWYEIKWHPTTRTTVRIWDSLKKFPGTSVKDLGKFVGLPKLDAPHFDKYYPVDYVPSQQEIDYCVRDSEVVSLAIASDLEQGLKRMTLASDCFAWGRDTCLGGRFYRDYFPELSEFADSFVRDGYNGGITYLKPEYEDLELHNIKVYDVNSLYPSVMAFKPLPIGYAHHTFEQPPEDKLYMVKFKTEFRIKQNRFPFIQLKNNLRFQSNEFISYSDGVEEVTMTNVDYNNFKNNYKIVDEFDHEYMWFDSQIGLMKPHVDYWMTKKKEYELQGLPFMRYIAKTMMNGFYGKTGTRIKRANVVPKLDGEKVSYSDRIETTADPVYVPYATFTTAWARDKLINSALRNWKDFVYCDTDSIHCFESDKVDLEIHPTDLGKWKDETSDGAYEYARYIKQKTYCHARPKTVDGKTIKEVSEIRCAGLNITSRSGLTFEQFKYGLKIENANLKMKTVPGGAILMPTDFELVKLEDDFIERFMNEETDRDSS